MGRPAGAPSGSWTDANGNEYAWRDDDDQGYILEYYLGGDKGERSTLGAWDEGKGSVVFTFEPSPDLLNNLGLLKGQNYWVHNQQYNISGFDFSSTPLDENGLPLGQSLTADAKRALDEAVAANEARFQRGDRMLTASNAAVMNNINQVGQQDERDITSRFRNLASAGQQDLTSRGLTGTTVLPNQRAANARKLSDALSMSRSNNAALRAQMQADLTRDHVGFIERRTDTSPDLRSNYALIQSLGASQ